MRVRVGWLLATALAYGIPGGMLLYAQLWEANDGLAWSQTSTVRLAWTAIVFLLSTALLSHREARAGRGWTASHAGGAFMLGAVVTWCVLEYQMLDSSHGWDNGLPPGYSCLDCAPRLPIVRQALVTAGIGTVLAAVLSPLVPRRRGGGRASAGAADREP